MERSATGLILAKAESTYGTDPTPTAALNALSPIAGTVNFTPEVDTVDRDILDPDWAPLIGNQALPRCKLTFETELMGNLGALGPTGAICTGTSANAIKIDPLLLACDLVATYTAESPTNAANGNVSYQPTAFYTTVGPSVTFYFYTGSRLHKVLGAKGTFKMTVKAGVFGRIQWEFQGLNGGTTDVALPTYGSTSFETTIPPIIKNTSLFITSASLTANPVVEEFTFDLGNAITRRDSMNATNGVEGFVVTKRDSKATLLIDANTEGSQTIFGDQTNGVFKSVGFNWGTAAGNKGTIAAKGLTKTLGYTEKNGMRMVQIVIDVRKLVQGNAIGSECSFLWG